MRIVTLTSTKTSNPVYARLVQAAAPTLHADGEKFAAGDVVVLDAAGSTPDDVSRAFPAFDAGATVLLLDAGDDHKQALAQRIGFRSHGSSVAYSAKRTDAGGATRVDVSEVGQTSAPASSVSQGGSADAEGANKQTFEPQVDFDNVEQAQTLTDEDIEFFVTSLQTRNVASLSEAAAAPSGLVSKSWNYSRSHSFTASGSQNSGTGLGPPPSKTISVNLNYVFQGALNNATESGSFQYLGVQETGIFQNNGMSNTSDTNYGWVLGSICPTITQPSTLYWYQSSPANTNDVTSVTTGSSVTVGFNASNTGGGGNASYTYSNSSTQNITDWYITQMTASSWIYAQNTPYDGNTTSGSTVADCINWYSGLVDTSSFPTISKSSLQFAVDAVWKTNSVLTSTQTISVSNQMRVDYIMIDTFLGLGTKWATWIYTSTPTDTFSIDMSVLT